MGLRRGRGTLREAGDKIVLKDGAADETTLQKGSNVAAVAFSLPNQAGTATLTSRDSTDTLTNKSISGSTNTLTNVPMSSVTGVLATANGGTGQNSTATFPTSGVVVTEAATETLTNKTLTSPVISSIVNTGTLTLPTSTDTLVGRATTDTLTNKTLDGDNNSLSHKFTDLHVFDSGGPANVSLGFDYSAAGGAAHRDFFVFSTTSQRNYTFPDASLTVVGTSTTQTLTNKSLSGAANTFTNIPLTTAVTGVLPTANGGTGQNSTATFPTSGVVVTEAATETLTNKTLTLPVISQIVNTGTLTLPTSTDTLVGRATIDTLTNKSISGSTNTLTNIPLGTAVTGQLPVANGGTGQATATAGFDALSPATTKGDLVAHDTSNNVRLPVGTDGQFLSADSTATTGLKWVNGGGTTFSDATFTLQDNGDATKQAKFEASGITTGTTRTFTFPDADTTLVGTGTTQTLTNKTVNGAVLNNPLIRDTGASPATQQVQFDLTGMSGSAHTDTFSFNSSSGRIYTLPDASLTFVGTSTTQTLTNKTLSGASNTFTNISLTTAVTGTLPVTNGGTGQTTTTAAFDALSPTTTKGDLVAHNGTNNVRVAVGTNGQFLTADSTAAAGVKWSTSSVTPTFSDAAFTLQDDGDATKQAQFQVSGITTGTTRTFTFPDANTTLVGTGTTQTLTNKTLDNTSTVTVKDANLTIQDDADTTKQAKFQASSITTGTTRTYTLPDTSDTLVTLAATQTLSNKTLSGSDTLIDSGVSFADDGDNTKKMQFQLSGITTATTRTLTVPDADLTIVGTATTQTLTNKTLTSPVISTISNTGTLTLPTSTDTLVGRATTDTLTNKDISSTTNTYRAASASQDGAVTTGTQTLAGDKTFSSGIVVGGNATGDITGATSVTNSKFYIGATTLTTANTDFSSFVTSWQKVGNWVYLKIGAQTHAVTGSYNSVATNQSLPAAITPTGTGAITSVLITNNGSRIDQLGIVVVGTDGVITVYKNPSLGGSNWTSSGSPTGGWDAIYLCYPTA